jgi:hypothetical protein
LQHIDRRRRDAIQNRKEEKEKKKLVQAHRNKPRPAPPLA